jgi:hypothetical protein
MRFDAANTPNGLAVCYRAAMCRSIKTLRRPEPAVSDDEIEAAALQFVRKVSGYRTPSQANSEAFEAAVAEISTSTRALLDSLVIRAEASA